AACAVAECGHTATIPSQAKPTPPNLVIILADDLGYADVGFNGCDDIPTPHIDRIAAEGVRFTSGYVTAAVCGPSRAGLITGRHQDRFGSSVNPTIDPSVINGPPRTERTLAELLDAAGYTSMAVGKWHLGTHPDLYPRERGFDEFFGFLSGGHNYLPGALELEDLSEVKGQWDWYRTKLLHNGFRVNTDGYLTDVLSDAGVEFIERVHRDGPFFLYLAYNAPHTPMQATDKYLARFASINNERRRTYAAMVSAMDDGVGRVLEALDQSGASDNTLVVFLSDNGGAKNNASRNRPLRGHKGDFYEGGLRVPFAMRWPAAMPRGVDYDRPVSALDIAGTAVAAAGPKAEAALFPDKPLDGVDLRPYLSGKATGDPHEALFWRRYGRQHLAMRRGDEKLIMRPGAQPRNQLFDLGNDIGERNNLSTAQRAAFDQLAERVRAWADEMVPPAYPSLGSWKP
ncbi:MAG: sulfatase-like hydrolase/transferase, partial [Planctomycetota bacterium]